MSVTSRNGQPLGSGPPGIESSQFQSQSQSQSLSKKGSRKNRAEKSSTSRSSRNLGKSPLIQSLRQLQVPPSDSDGEGWTTVTRKKPKMMKKKPRRYSITPTPPSQRSPPHVPLTNPALSHEDSLISPTASPGTRSQLGVTVGEENELSQSQGSTGDHSSVNSASLMDEEEDLPTVLPETRPQSGTTMHGGRESSSSQGSSAHELSVNSSASLMNEEDSPPFISPTVLPQPDVITREESSVSSTSFSRRTSSRTRTYSGTSRRTPRNTPASQSNYRNNNRPVQQQLMANTPIPTVRYPHLPDLAFSEDQVHFTCEGITYTPEINLLDIPLKHFGVFLNVKQSLTSLSIRHVPQFREIYIQYLQGIINEPDSVIAWKKFFILPILLFTDNNKHRIRAITSRLFNNFWGEFTVAILPKNKILRAQHTTTPNAQDDSLLSFPDEFQLNQKEKKVMGYLKVGEVGKAARYLQNTAGVAEANRETLEKLQEKFETVDYGPETQEMQDSVDSFMLLDRMPQSVYNENLVQFEWEELRDYIKSAGKLINPGPHKLRFEHLQQMAGRSANNQIKEKEKYFCISLAKVLTFILHGKEPNEVSAVLKGYQLVPMAKGVNDVRPIGMGSTLRKLVAQHIVSQYHPEKGIESEQTKSYFEDGQKLWQMAFKSCGTERIIHLVNMYYNMQQLKQMDVYLMDGTNAFGRCNNRVTSSIALEQFQQLAPHHRNMYLDKFEDYAGGRGFYYTGSSADLSDGEGVHIICATSGVQQGDALGTMAFCITIQPLLRSLKEHLENMFPDRLYLILFYVDDGNIVAESDIMQEAIRFIKQHGQQYGYQLNTRKGTYLMGKKGCTESIMLKNSLINQLGISAMTIKIHPDDLQEYYQLQNLEADQIQLRYKEDVQNYGVEILGSFVGTDEFIKHKLDEKLGKLKEELILIEKFPHSQAKFILFQKSFCVKANHLARTIQPQLLEKFAKEYIGLQKWFIEKFLNMEIGSLPTLTWEQMCMPFTNGGIGIHRLDEVAPAAYLASISQCTNSKDMIVELSSHPEEFIRDTFKDTVFMQRLSALPAILHLTYANISEAVAAISQIRRRSPDREEGSVQHQLHHTLIKKRLDSIQNTLEAGGGAKSNQRALFISNSNSDSYRWLQVLPKYSDYTINNHAFINCFRQRYLLPIPGLVGRTHCNLCKRVNDVTGHHFGHGCCKSGVFNRVHEDLKYCFKGILNHAGVQHTVEERGVFNSVDDEPNNKRGDLIVTIPVSVTVSQKYLIDVTAVSKFHVTGGSRGVGGLYHNGIQLDVAVNRKFKEKMDKYEECCRTNGFQCVPIVFDTAGHVHPDSAKFIKKIAVQGSAQMQSRVSPEVLYGFYMRKLSVCMVKAIGNSIHLATLGIFNNNSHLGVMDLDSREELDYAIADHAVVHL